MRKVLAAGVVHKDYHRFSLLEICILSRSNRPLALWSLE